MIWQKLFELCSVLIDQETGRVVAQVARDGVFPEAFVVFDDGYPRPEKSIGIYADEASAKAAVERFLAEPRPRSHARAAE